MLRIKENLFISVYLECPVGVPLFFFKGDKGWERDFEKEAITDYFGTKEKEEFFTVSQYLETDKYLNLFAQEIIFLKKIPVNHWNFIFN